MLLSCAVFHAGDSYRGDPQNPPSFFSHVNRIRLYIVLTPDPELDAPALSLTHHANMQSDVLALL